VGVASYIRKEAAVPVPVAVVDQVPAIVVAPPELVKNVAGRVIVAKRPLGSDAAQFAGSEPLKIFKVPEEPTVV